LIRPTVAVGERFAANALDLTHRHRVDADPFDPGPGGAIGPDPQPCHDARGEVRVLERRRHVADAALERIDVRPRSQRVHPGQGQLDDAGSHQQIDFRPRLELAILRVRPIIAVAFDTAVRRHVRQLEPQQPSRLGHAPWHEPRRHGIERRHDAEHQRASRQFLPDVVGRLAGPGQQRNPQRAINRLLVDVDAVDDTAIERHRLVQLHVVGKLRLVRGVEQPVVVEQFR
jgi:hypothetical protein